VAFNRNTASLEFSPRFSPIRALLDAAQQSCTAKKLSRTGKLARCESSQVNALCLPGGKIVVYTGILPYTKTEGALSAVMGHEMAHAAARHGSQRLLRTSLAHL
jgi:predicted Zn-dependent protease